MYECGTYFNTHLFNTLRICKNEKISGAQMHFMCSINNGGKEYIKFCMSIVKIDICPENREYRKTRGTTSIDIDQISSYNKD